MRLCWLLALGACVQQQPRKSLAEMRGGVKLSIDAQDTYVLHAAMDVTIPPTMRIDMEIPDCAAFAAPTYAVSDFVRAQVMDPSFVTVDGVESCVQAQATLTFPLDAFRGPAQIEISDGSDTWTIGFLGLANFELQTPSTLTLDSTATMTWDNGPHIDNGCLRVLSNLGFQPHACKFDSGITFPPDTPDNIVTFTTGPLWPAQGSIQFDMVGEYTQTPTCDGPLSCDALLHLENLIPYTGS